MNDVRNADIVLRRIATLFIGACANIIVVMLVIVAIHFAQL